MYACFGRCIQHSARKLFRLKEEIFVGMVRVRLLLHFFSRSQAPRTNGFAVAILTLAYEAAEGADFLLIRSSHKQNPF